MAMRKKTTCWFDCNGVAICNPCRAQMVKADFSTNDGVNMGDWFCRVCQRPAEKPRVPKAQQW